MKKKLILKKLTAGVITFAMVVTNCVSAYAASTSNDVSGRETKNAKLSMNAATEGMVLLENKNNVLPMASKGDIALFGEGAYNTVKGGTGSGDVNQRYKVSVKEAIETAGYNITSSEWLKNSEELYDEGLAEYNEGSHSMWDSYSFPDNEVTDADIKAASAAKTAIYVVSRNSGEGNDRTETEGDYYLTDTESANIKKMAESFENSIVVLNVGGVIDTKFVKEIPKLDSVVLMSQGGMEGGTAAVKVLNGEVTPSGKLTDTWAVNYSDYPSSKTFSDNDGNSKQEDYTDDIYVGYRYFDTFNVTPAYEFGYGLSYTTFDTKVESVTADENKVTVKAKVTNTGSKYSGKEVAQVYFSAPSGNLEKPYQEMAAYGKTDLLAPGESQTLTISYKTSEMSSYSEEDAAYVMEKGDYIIRVGNSSRNTHVGAVLTLDSTVKTEQLSNQMKVDKKITTLSNKGVTPYSYADGANEISNAQRIPLDGSKLELIDGNNASQYDNEAVTTTTTSSSDEDTTTVNDSATTSASATLYDVYNKKITMEQFASGLSVEKLADIVEGVGWGGSTAPIVGAQSNSVKGAAGETTGKYYDSDGIPNIVLADGPAGIRITQSYDDNGQTYYQYCTAWPVGTLLAQTWNPEIVEEVGKHVGEEMTEYGVTLWLAPGMNIHRNPLCGRNFEYYSEDPYITGTMGAAATKGVQSNPGIGVTIKHFATNNQENNRSTENNTVSERALREIYLKGFEMVVKSAQPMAIMSSYNQINGTYSGANYDLLTNIARGEWKFDGLVMTDWFSNANPIQSMHAGNDLIMPGGSQATLINALTVTTGAAVSTTTGAAVSTTNNTLLLGDLQKCAMHVLNVIMQSTQFAKMNADKGVKAVSYTEKYNDLKDYLTFTKDDTTTDGTTTGGSESGSTTTGGSGSNGATTNSSSSHHHSSSSSSNNSSSSSSSSTDSDSKSNNVKSNNGTEVKNEWNQNTDGTWSFVNSNGEKATGWIQGSNTWYYLNSSGIMQTGWIKDSNGLWYYLNDNGSMKTGWFKDVDGKWYYFNNSGDMAVNTTIDGYEVDSTGAYLS